MQITKRQSKLDLSVTDDGTRSPGIHISDVLRSIALDMGFLKEDDEDVQMGDKFAQHVVLRMMVGLAWENFLAAFILAVDVHFHPGEYAHDGIAMTVDGISYDTRLSVFRVHEFKATWKSSNREIDGEWLWLAQIKSYCKATGIRHVTLHVLYLNGNYRGSGPQYVEYDISFSRRDIEENWTMVRNYMPLYLKKIGEGDSAQ